VDLWLDTELFEEEPEPLTVEEYMTWIGNQKRFIDLRNMRIAEFVRDASGPM